MPSTKALARHSELLAVLQSSVLLAAGVHRSCPDMTRPPGVGNRALKLAQPERGAVIVAVTTSFMTIDSNLILPIFVTPGVARPRRLIRRLRPADYCLNTTANRRSESLR
jgi:hypothetical protein